MNPLYLVGPHSILLNPVLEFNPTIAMAPTATFKEEPTAEDKAIKVAEHIVIVGKKQFDMMMGGDQESDSTSSLTATITHVKLEPLDEGAIPKDADDSLLPEDIEETADMVIPGHSTAADEVGAPAATDNVLASAPPTAGEPNAQAVPPKAKKWCSILIM